ncbi:protein PERCC1 [Podargus strigoides]
MAAGIIWPLAELRLPSPFPHSLLLPVRPEPDFPDLSEEEEEEDEEDEEETAEESMGPELAIPNATETTLRLLEFSERISCDIQQYFGQWGREEATGSRGVPEDCSSPRCAEAQPEAVALWGSPTAVHRLGPLAELFEYGVHRCLPPRVAGGKTQRLERKYGHITPMHRRKLPPSFWREPGPSLLHPSTPDFSDLLANWMVEPGPELPPEPGRLGLSPSPGCDPTMAPGAPGPATCHTVNDKPRSPGASARAPARVVSFATRHCGVTAARDKGSPLSLALGALRLPRQQGEAGSGAGRSQQPVFTLRPKAVDPVPLSQPRRGKGQHGASSRTRHPVGTCHHLGDPLHPTAPLPHGSAGEPAPDRRAGLTHGMGRAASPSPQPWRCYQGLAEAFPPLWWLSAGP